MVISNAHGVGIGLMLAAVLMIVVASAFWVYGDAKQQAKRGNHVVFSTKSFEVSTPAKWFFGCLMCWELVFPAYVNSRRH